MLYFIGSRKHVLKVVFPSGTKHWWPNFMTCFRLLSGIFLSSLKCKIPDSWGGTGVTDLDAQREVLQLG